MARAGARRPFKNETKIKMGSTLTKEYLLARMKARYIVL